MSIYVERYGWKQLHDTVFSSSVDGRVWDTFKPTLPTSTYSIGFVISEFSELKDPNKVSVWARENGITNAVYALQESQKILKYFENYIDIPYTLPQLYLVALPQCKTAATTNWGLTMYR